MVNKNGRDYSNVTIVPHPTLASSDFDGDVVSIIPLNDFDSTDEIQREYTITITSDDLEVIMQDLGIPVTEENITKLLKAKVLENTYYALDNQIHDEMRHMFNELSIDPEDIDDAEFCDESNKLITKTNKSV